ncbi:MAG TPA: phosphomannomutase/phosphoglucomutase [Actinomycetales bacterium]|nr:phosphomannomutase/phosphoglucomutase [Actinomycetales bacterium]
MASLSTIVKAYDVRGLVPDELDEDVARALGCAFAHVVGVADAAVSSSAATAGAAVPTVEAVPGRVVVGHDMRASSPGLSQAFAQGVTGQGGDVVLIGLCSTDGLYFASGSLGAPGAMFTASHNPAGYNGIKLCRAGARPIGQDTGLDDVRRLAARFLQEGPPALPQTHRPGTITEHDVLSEYAAYLRGQVPAAASRRLKVVVDAGNGMAGLTVPAVLGDAAGLPALDVDVVPLYFDLDGTFPNHEANPLVPDNLRDLQAAVVEHGADLGLAFDGDADRCFVVDERGEPVSPSAVTALVAAREIARDRTEGRQPVVIHNVISSRAVPEVVAEHGGRPVRTRVGHSFIKARMAEEQAVFGGEHSAHYYFRDFWFADSGLLAALHVLAALAEQAEPLSRLAAGYERYVGSGEINSTVADVTGRLHAVRDAFAGDGVVLDELDGLTLTHDDPDGAVDWWLNVRPSNTEPLLRLNVEGADRETMERVRDQALAVIRASAF